MLYCAATGPEGTELWRSDGTAGGTLLVKDIQPGTRWAAITRGDRKPLMR